MNKQIILSKLDKAAFYAELVPSLKVNGKPEALGLCPFHDDHNPSLSVNIETGLYFCHVCNDGGDLFKFYMRHRNVDFREALSQLSEYSEQARKKVSSRVECIYQYADAAGMVLFEVVRYIPKTFRQRRPDGKGGYVYNLEDVEIVPYNLPKIITSDTVFICEGEKDCDNLANLGLTATTNPMGAGKWRDEFGQYFTGKDIIVLCDNDEVGKKHGHDIAQKLSKHAKSIKLIEQLPGVPHKGDVSDWLKLNQDTQENQKDKLFELAKNATQWTPAGAIKVDGLVGLIHAKDLLNEVEEETDWLIEGLLPSGGFSVITAKPKVGKSTLVKQMALSITRGLPFFGREVMQGAIIYLALEDKRSEIRKHLKAMGITSDDPFYLYAGGAPVDAIKRITADIAAIKPVLLVIDTLFRLIRLKDGNSYNEVTNGLEPLIRLARDSGVSILAVHHSKKGDSDIEDCLLGSTAIFGSVDTTILLKRYEGYRTIQSRQRYGDDMPETVLVFDKMTGTTDIGGAKEDQDIHSMENAIFDFLEKQKEPVIEKIITDEVEGRNALKRKALRELVKQNEIVRTGKGEKGNPYTYACTPEFACTQHVPDFGYKQNNQKNDPENFARTLVPRVMEERAKKKGKTADTTDGCRGDSCTHVPVFPETEKKLSGTSILTKNEGGKDEPFEVEFLEVVE